MLFGPLLLGAVLAALALQVFLATVGIRAIALGRVPGKRLRRAVERPRVWGAGALSLALTMYTHSPSHLALSLGLVAIGYMVHEDR
ncbi:hypothetical protein [uncultured Streptomyces sp.]|uniref:hypothetical protein n=1 Tax=uncultured Streptomyces sp. TaxID=174707 RepID=UPI002619E159|nr:hypothetical protein [uncultured Streptomyces sp.]